MACLANYTLQGIPASCEANIGGIKAAWLGYAEDFEFGFADDSAHTISISAQTGATLHEYYFNRQTGSIQSVLTKDEANGPLYYTNTLTLVFTRMEQSKHLEVEALAKERLVGVVLDNNGEYFLLGADGYLSLTDDTTGSGTAFDDRNGYELQLSAMSSYKPISITKDQLQSMIGA